VIPVPCVLDLEFLVRVVVVLNPNSVVTKIRTSYPVLEAREEKVEKEARVATMAALSVLATTVVLISVRTMTLSNMVSTLVDTTVATVARVVKEAKVAKEAAAFPVMKVASFVKRITTGIRCTGTLKIMPLDMVVT